MVGRKRSKGCKSCLRRHLKCDETKPQCLRCERDGLQCGGYAALQIVSYEPCTKKTPLTQLTEVNKVHPTRFAVAPALDDEVLFAHLVHGIFSISANGQSPTWPGLGARGKPGSLALDCLRSLAQSFYGVNRKSQTLARRGQQSYVACLRSINDGLADPSRQKTTDTLVSTAILGIYEMFFTTSESGWIKHGLGTAALLELRGPAMKDEETFEIFQSSRFFMVLASLAACQPSFLSRPEWKTRPWTSTSTPKSTPDLLLDILVDLPDLRYKYQAYEASGGECAVGRGEIFRCAMQMLDALRLWRLKWETLPESMTTEAVDKEEVHPVSWTTNLIFTSLSAANFCCLCDAATMLAIETALYCAEIDDLDSGHASILLSTAREAAIEVCRSLDFQLANTWGRIGHLTVLWPLRMAWKILGKSYTSEGQWLESKLQQITSQGDSWSISTQSLTFTPGSRPLEEEQIT